MYFIKTPQFIQSLFPNFLWKAPSQGKELYLTFDDGPTPEVTEWVLDQLEQYNAKATFFCVGSNVEANPTILEQIAAKGHTIGNHTYDHVDGWATENIPYFHNVRRCAHLVKSELFRPPFGRIRPKQAQFLQRHYRIVMWDVLSGDFDPKITNEQCLNNVIEHATQGSIVVMHDSVKAFEKLQYILPRILEYYSERGYTFAAIEGTQATEKQPLRQTA